jgi:cellulose synthase/poly-beta-1,6-N-acetylglucosamine synthase-like glycosyltransferase
METLIRLIPMQDTLLAAYFFSLSILFLFGLHGLVMVYFFIKTRSVKRATPAMPSELPVVTIQLPIFNEVYVIERLVEAVCAIDYPKDRLEIQLLDDSTDETVDTCAHLAALYSAQGYDIKHLHRTDRTGFKAGALKAGLATARGEFIAIFDADFVPKTDFLQKTIPHFFGEDGTKIGMVQTRWEHLNEDYSFLTRVQALALDGHFAMEQNVRNKAGFFINFNGTAGVWRKETILDAGNWQHDTITEDMDLSYRAQLRGWKFVYLNDVTSPAELPAEINALKSQQFRWTKGAVEVAKKMLPTVWKANLPLEVKLQSTVHLGANIVFPFMIVVALLNVPLVIIKNSTGHLYDWYFNLMILFTLASVSTFSFYTCAQYAIHEDWRKRIMLFPLFMAGSTGLAVNNTRAVLEALFNKKSEFVRTPKFKVESKHDTWKTNKYKAKKIHGSVVVELALALYYFVGLCISCWFLEIAAIPFQLMFFLGFGLMGVLSLRHALTR